MNYYEEIKTRLINNEVYSKIKDYSKERNTLETYFEIGKLLYKAGSKYGENIIGQYANKLIVEVGKKYNRSTLFRMKQFYSIFSNIKVAPMVRQLTWSHCLLLLPIKNIDEIIYYINQVSNQHLSKRQLQEKIKNKEYDRLPKSIKNKETFKKKIDIKELIPNPILIKNTRNLDIVNEKMIHNMLLENISSFLNELGNGYSYIKDEYPIKIGDRYNYIDFLLFNIEYNCYVVIELKNTVLKKEHIGQIEIYMNYIDNNLKKINHDKTIGIIICRKDNRFIIEYASDKRIISREYKLVS
jgi:predicted nuclease of restriction endonuclease-like (RecB) superfamily